MKNCLKISFIMESAKEKPVTGRMTDVMKKLRLSSHETGEDCHCKRHGCFDKINETQRKVIIQQFNLLNYNEQNSYLTGLINIVPVQQRRPRNDKNIARFNDASYRYKIRVNQGSTNISEDFDVCYKAFLSLHGIGKKRLETIQKSLKMTGASPRDKRGTNEKKHTKSKETIQAVVNHINSFKSRPSHYSINKTSKRYLPEELNVKKMYGMYVKLKKPPVSYEFYRKIFNTRFNLSFGYPRSDTCSECDQFLANIKVLELKLKANLTEDEKKKIEVEMDKLEVLNRVHKAKAETFYERKRLSRQDATKKDDTEAIAMDFQKNLNLPNVTTNDVYYKRQLTFVAFNIHELASNNAIFYTYVETVGGKGPNEVVSMLNHYIFTQLKTSVRHLHLFCDSCAGQNKNFTVFRYLHYVVHVAKRLSSVKVTFPVRGHSYLECDRDMGLVNQKVVAELPQDWMAELATCRLKPSPFIVHEVDQAMLRDWSAYFNGIYKKKSPFPTRPIRELRITEAHPLLIEHRSTYNGHWTSSDIQNQIGPINIAEDYQIGHFFLPRKLYNGKRNFSSKLYPMF